MNTKCCLLSIVFLLLVYKGYTQSNYQAGILPGINFNKKLEKDWSINFKIESRHLLEEGEIGANNSTNYTYLFTDFSWVVSKKIKMNQSIAGGYLIRIRNQKPTHRFIQQYTITKNYTGFRLSHRFVADETFDEGESIQLRLRYRISTLFPFRGQSIDPREYYLKINHEYLNSFQRNEYDLEVRLIPFLGYAFTHSNKLEMGLDYRINSFLESNTSNRFWLSINWYISF